MWTFLDDNSSAAAALVARRLGLSEHAWKDLLFGDFDTRAPATTTCMDVAVRCCTRTATVVAENILLHAELFGG